MPRAEKILVTGTSGFLGGSLLRRLVSEGRCVRALVHQNEPVDVAGPFEILRGDLRDPEDCRRAVEGIDLVFHFAAVTSGAAVMVRTPLVHLTPNVVMNTLLLEASHAAGVQRFVFPSSGAAYPPTGDRPVREEEMFTAEPYDAYYAVASMKRFSELLCEMYANRVRPPMSTVVVRPSNVYGPFDKFDPSTSHVTAALVRKVAERLDPIPVWGDGSEIRDLIYIDDFLDGVLAAANARERFVAVNIASGRGASVREILEILLEIDRRSDARVEFDTSKPSTIPVRLMDTSLAREHLGFEARTSLEEGLARTLTWFRHHQTEEELHAIG